MKLFLLAILSFFLFGCSDENVTFYPENADVVSVKAYVIRESDSTRERRKADTILPTDSVVLLAVIEPSRSIRMTEFYWQIDSGATYSEFSHRASIASPGKHLAKFILLDRFSDTLQDSVSLWVAPPPSIDSESWIPQNETQGIPPDSAISFAWNASAENFLATMRYSFSLLCGRKILLDTILPEAHVTYKGNLPEQELCLFDVSASDDFGKSSSQRIHSIFFTGKNSFKENENVFFKIQGPVQDSLEYRLNSADAETSSGVLEGEGNDSIFSIRNVKPGTYRLVIRSNAYPDYMSDTVSLSVRKGKISYIKNIPLRDTVVPKIRSLSQKDSIDWKDTLRFEIEEKGFPVSSSDIRIVFDGNKISDWIFENGSLRIFTENLQKSFTFHPLTISVTDRAKNFATKNFTVAPGKSCIRTLPDTVLSPGNALSIPIENTCPNLLPKRFFWDIDDDGHWDGEAVFEEEASISKTFSHSLFRETETSVRVKILYASGEEFSEKFTVTTGDSSK